jgi:hypothetical protein
VDFVGPFSSHRVVVDGWQVPLLEAHPMAGGMVTLVLDQRFGLDLTLAEAERMMPWIAEAIAVAAGFASHPKGPDEPRQVPSVRPRQFLRLNWFQTEEAAEMP